MTRLTLALLGPPLIMLNGRAISFTYRKVEALLIYLAVERRRPHPRAVLAGLLWPDVPEQVARQSLSQALTTLRGAIGERSGSGPGRAPLLVVDAETIQLSPEAIAECDVAAFQSLIAASEGHQHHAWRTCAACRERLRQAATLYRGSFLADFALRDGTLFEEWAQQLREQLFQQAVSICEQLAEQAEWRGELAEAIAQVRRQIALDPWADLAHRELIRLLALNGQPAAALAHYEQLRRTLAQELAAEPDAATGRLAEQIRAAPHDAEATLRRFQAVPGAIPAPPTALLGRDNELQAILRLLRDEGARALTISGPPGVGKTRLALAAANELRYDFSDGVWFIELAAIGAAHLAPQLIAVTCGVKERPSEPIAATLVSALRSRHALLVLDNCEHLPELAPFVAELLAACPTLYLLMTSRAPLRIRAEQLLPLAPLAMPAPGADLAAISAAPAVQLLLARAQAGGSAIRLSAANAPACAAICAGSDGLPLAIELIAAGLIDLAPEEVLAQLAARLAAPNDGPRDLPARQRSLRAAIAWGLDQLGPTERAIFAQLGAFVGGATLEALQTASGTEHDLRPALEALQRQSLVQAASVAGELRYTQLATIRAYALDLLAAEGVLERARCCQAHWLAGFSEQAYVELLGSAGARWGARIAAEIDNLRAAQRWALDGGQIETALRIATGIWRFHWQRGHLREGLDWLEQGLAQRASIAPEVAMRALRAAGVLAMGMGDHGHAVARLEAARDLALRHERSDEYGAALTNLGLALREQGRLAEACTCLEEAVVVNRTMTDRPVVAKFPLIILAGLYGRIGKIERAAMLYAECLTLNRELGDDEGTANALYGLAFVAHARGDYRLARELGEQSLALYRSMSHQFGIGWVTYLFGDIARAQSLITEALTAYRASLAICCERDDSVSGSFVLDDIATVIAGCGHVRLAVVLCGAAAALREAADVVVTPDEAAKGRRISTLGHERLGAAGLATALTEGRALSVTQAALLIHAELPPPPGAERLIEAAPAR